MYENTKVDVKIALGNIPLSIAQDASQFGFPTQPNQNNPLNEQFPANSVPPVGFIEPAPVPGFAQKVPPYGPPSFISAPYPQQSMNSAQNPAPYTQSSLYPQTQLYNQSQLPYPDVNVQQPTFNPSYQNLNPEVTPVPTAPSI